MPRGFLHFPGENGKIPGAKKGKKTERTANYGKYG